jgi:hypothetical protein
MPHLFTNAYIAVGSICGAVSLLHLLIFMRRRAERVHLIFCGHGPVLRIVSPCWISRCTGNGRGRVCPLPTKPPTRSRFALDRLCLVHSTLSTQRSTLAGNFWFPGLYGLAGVVEPGCFPRHSVRPHVDDLNRVMLPWGETDRLRLGPANPWRLLPDLAWFIVLAYALDAAIGLAIDGLENGRAWFFGPERIRLPGDRLPSRHLD